MIEHHFHLFGPELLADLAPEYAGGRQFIEKFRIGLFVPMHFTSSGFQSAWRMKQFTDEAGIPFWSISREGETLAAGYDAASGIHLLSQEPE